MTRAFKYAVGRVPVSNRYNHHLVEWNRLRLLLRTAKSARISPESEPQYGGVQKDPGHRRKVTFHPSLRNLPVSSRYNYHLVDSGDTHRYLVPVSSRYNHHLAAVANTHRPHGKLINEPSHQVPVTLQLALCKESSWPAPIYQMMIVAV